MGAPSYVLMMVVAFTHLKADEIDSAQEYSSESNLFRIF
jgi:hypothetical protein